jgi:hypothetical protein
MVSVLGQGHKLAGFTDDNDINSKEKREGAEQKDKRSYFKAACTRTRSNHEKCQQHSELTTSGTVSGKSRHGELK